MKNTPKEEKAKLRIFFGEIEGDNQTIREGLKSIASAVNRTFSNDVKTVRVITVNGQDSLTAEEVEQVLDEETEAYQDEVQESDRPNPTSKPRKPRKAPSYSHVKELNLMPQGQEAFTDFFQRKAPADSQEAVTVTVFWLRTIAELEGIGINHIYTCFKEAKYSVPTDIAGVCRNTASRKGWLDTSDTADIKVTTQGENLVEHKLPSGKK